MPRGYVSRFDLYPSRINAHFVGPTGTVAEHANRVGREAEIRAKILAPRRTGELARSVKWGPFPQGPYMYAISLGAYVHYAPFVSGGTHSPITPWGGHWLRLPASRMASGRFIYRQYVRGQRPNDFLARAMSGALGFNGVALLG